MLKHYIDEVEGVEQVEEEESSPNPYHSENISELKQRSNPLKPAARGWTNILYIRLLEHVIRSLEQYTEI